MTETLAVAHAEKRKCRGRKPKLNLEEMLLATLGYTREHRTYARIVTSYGTDESGICRAIKRAEDFLTKSGTLPPPEKKPAKRRQQGLLLGQRTPCLPRDRRLPMPNAPAALF